MTLRRKPPSQAPSAATKPAPSGKPTAGARASSARKPVEGRRPAPKLSKVGGETALGSLASSPPLSHGASIIGAGRHMVAAQGADTPT